MKKTFCSVLIAGVLILVLGGCAGVGIKGGPVASGSLRDGVYEGYAQKEPVTVKVNVTIKDQKISNIDLIYHRTWKGEPAEAVIPGEIIAAQSTRVDVVTGATFSSVAIMNAVEDAVSKAQ